MRKSYDGSNDQNRRMSSMDTVCLAHGSEVILMQYHLGFSGYKSIKNNLCYSFLIVLTLLTGILNDNWQASKWTSTSWSKAALSFPTCWRAYSIQVLLFTGCNCDLDQQNITWYLQFDPAQYQEMLWVLIDIIFNGNWMSAACSPLIYWLGGVTAK